MERLVDSFNRQINYLRVSITDRCNLRCTYCLPQEGLPLFAPEEILSYEEILQIVKIAVKKGISKVRVTGGEPLVRKGVVYFIQSLSQVVGVKDLSMTTNGVLLKEYARDLAQAGLKRINVSLDSLRSERYREITGKDFLERVWEGIREAERVGLSPLKINVVAMRGFNDDEIIDFARLCLNNFYQIRFIEFMPLGDENNWRRENFITSKEIKAKIENFQKLIPVEDKERKGPAEIYRFERAKGEIGFISPISNHFCLNCNRIRLTADGKIRTCLFSDEELDIKTPLREGKGEKELEKILDMAIYKKPEKHGIDPSLFKKCSRYMVEIGG